jgi:hypothetical protein
MPKRQTLYHRAAGASGDGWIAQLGKTPSSRPTPEDAARGEKESHLSTQVIGRRIQLVIAVVVLSLGLGGAALAQHSSGSVQVNVTILDGKIKVSTTSFVPGKITLVAVNKGSASHALAIMGTGLMAKQTPTIASGKTAQLTVMVKAGTYHLWDPVKSSMSHATLLTVKAATASSSSSSSSSSTGHSTGNGTPNGVVTCDHAEVGTDCSAPPTTG